MRRHRAVILCAWVASLAGCKTLFPPNPLASVCADSCYKLEGPAQAECLSRCNNGH